MNGKQVRWRYKVDLHIRGGVSCFYLAEDNENLNITSSLEVMVDYDKISWPFWQAAPDRDSFSSAVFTT